MTRIINACPHDLTFFLPDGTTVVLPASGIVARAEERTAIGGILITDALGTMPLVMREYGEFTGLPPQQPGVAYVVSAIAYAASEGEDRDDLYMVADLVRDEAGRIIGARALAI